MDSIIMRFRDKFIDEARKLLDSLEVALLGLERTPGDKELIDSSFRVMHTLKGVSGMYGFMHIYHFTHHFESIYQSIRDGQMGFNKTIFDLTFASIDLIRNLLIDENLADPANISEHERLLNLLNDQNFKDENLSPIQPVAPKDKDDATWHILMHTNEKQFFRGISFTSIFKDLADLGEFTIIKIDNLEPGEFDTWSVYLYSNASESDIREVFMFIEDDCVINRIYKGNIISPDQNINPLYHYQPELNKDIEESLPEKLTPQVTNETDHDNKAPEKKRTAPVGKIKELEKEVSATNASVPQEKALHKRISVDSQKLDNLMFLVSELITVNSQLLVTSNNPKHFELRPLIEKVDNLSKQFRNNALEIRLVPISESVVRFQRLIRDLSKQLDKKIEFLSQGADTELDKNIIDQLTDPIMHLIRNCLDHGIEPASERLASGKPETGTIKLSAVNTGNSIILTVEDDGRGLDANKIRHKAIEKGLISANDQLSDKELYNLIFLPGFSTAENITDVSGRGVGMDAVKRRISELHGEIFIDSEKGKGSRFTLKLQQSLSIVDSLLFRVGDTCFTVPICDIEICEHVKAADIEKNRHTSTLPFRNDLIYFSDLHQLLHIDGNYEPSSRMIIVGNETSRIALIVDQIIGEHQAVLKPLGKSFHNQPYLTSASQLGDGNIAFMLDVGAIIRNAGHKAA